MEEMSQDGGNPKKQIVLKENITEQKVHSCVRKRKKTKRGKRKGDMGRIKPEWTGKGRVKRGEE